MSFVNFMLAAMLAACLFRCLKWAKHAVRICYASSKNFQVLFSSGNSYRWFFLQPFKMLRAIFATASEMRGKSPAFGDKFFSVSGLRAYVRLRRDARRKLLHMEELADGFVHGEALVLLSRLHFGGGDMRNCPVDRLHFKDIFHDCRFARKMRRRSFPELGRSRAELTLRRARSF